MWRARGSSHRQAQRQPGQPLAVARGQAPARLRPRVQPAQLHAQHRRLHLVEPAAVAELDVVIAAGVAVVAQPAHVLGHVVAIREQQAGVAAGAEVLGRIERQAGDVAPAADRAARPRWRRSPAPRPPPAPRRGAARSRRCGRSGPGGRTGARRRSARVRGVSARSSAVGVERVRGRIDVDEHGARRRPSRSSRRRPRTRRPG